MIYELLKCYNRFELHVFTPRVRKSMVDSGNLSELFCAWFDQFHGCIPGVYVKAFGDVIGLDTTNDSNDARLQLYLSVFGDGEDIAHAKRFHVFTEESGDSIGAALSFQRDTVKLSHRTVLIDKDFKAIFALKAVLPDKTVFLCCSYVIKYFRQSMAIAYLPSERP